MSPVLQLSSLSVRRGECPVVDRADLSVAAGEFVGLLGPNGAGKTTLMRAILGLLPSSGENSLRALRPEARARHAAFLPQEREIAWPMPAEDVVALGRMPHPAATPAQNRAAIERAIAEMGLEGLRHRPATELSGGEKARVLIARALAQEAPVLLADEPTAGLDPAAQISVMEVFAAHARAGGTVIASLHDLGLAARHCTRLVLMARGRIVADGAPRDVLSPENLAEVFHLRAHVDWRDEGPIFQPLSVIGR
ncbi:ABC transporter ATP-binding protein [Pseudothioclava arenosa]|uniref:ABC transporter n=1 Tax=Pseudothioclava arenosa TaxID=1795308 RepID=A0A2A4CS02_9RHOB|nr:ABC transporter ATP-binding protein [Pseudothioclava arenosa]PCD76874.1 ABC transporter [Pseudothioclava arenosa]